MPDVVNALKFQKKMIAVENEYLQKIEGYRTEARRVLLDIVTRDGVSRQAVQQMTHTIGDLGTNIVGAGAQASREIRKHVQNYTRKQMELAKRAGLTDSTDLAPILNRGAAKAQDGEQSYMTNASAWLGQLETSLQIQAAKLRISNASPQEITDRLLNERLADGRASVWLANGNQAQQEEQGNVWAYGVGLLGAYLAIYNETQPETEYKQQAIAAIDKRTTDCCLRVHGQIQPMEEPFQLTGTPRYADEIQDPPFHWYCRTAEALYHEDFEQFGIPTEKMRDMADLEMEARELTGRRVTIHPSHATSRRIGALPSS